MTLLSSTITAFTLFLIGFTNGSVKRASNNFAITKLPSFQKETTEDTGRTFVDSEDLANQERLVNVCGLSEERLQSIQQLQRWLDALLELEDNEDNLPPLRERAVDVIFSLVRKNPEVDELSSNDLVQVVSMSGISGLFFDELLECVGNGASLSYEEILYMFCLSEPHRAAWRGAQANNYEACDMLVHRKQ